MAKVYKVTMYLVDANGYYDFDEDNEYLKSDIEYSLERRNVFPAVANVQESEVFEWHDDLKINGMSSSFDDYEDYIK